MRRRDLAPILTFALVGVVLVVGALSGAGVTGGRSTALKVAVLAVIVAAILATRIGPRNR
jgi:hypothetical protein